MTRYIRSIRYLSSVALAGVLLLALSSPAAARYRPLATEPLNNIPKKGEYRIDLGAEFRDSESFPFSGLKGELLRLGTMGYEIGLGPDAAFFVRGTAYQTLSIASRTAAPNSAALSFTGNDTDAVGDFTLGTTMRFRKTTSDTIGLGFQVAVKLPNTPNQSGLGNDETDVFGTLIAEKRAGKATVFANAGFAILGNPMTLNSQKDKKTFGLGVSVPVWDRYALLGEVNGRSGSSNPGTEDRAVARLALQQAKGDWRWDAVVSAGLKKVDSDWGISVGVTHDWGS